MIQHLPNDVFWAIIQHSDDVKACVAMWVCCKDAYCMFDKKTFWEELSYHKFPNETVISSPHPSSPSPLHKPSLHQPMDIFWINYAKCNGCICCHRPFAKNRNFNNYVDNVKLYDMSLYTCATCKDALGDSLVHKSCVEPWQSNLFNKFTRQGSQSKTKVTFRPIFQNYYGVNQVHQSNGYKTKCITCIKNIRNGLCPHFKCGACCGCKFHKSHYNNLRHDTYNLSDVFTASYTFSFSESNFQSKIIMKNNQKNKNIKLSDERQRPTKPSSYHKKRYYVVSIEI
jgi:hypothetical protein